MGCLFEWNVFAWISYLHLRICSAVAVQITTDLVLYQMCVKAILSSDRNANKKPSRMVVFHQEDLQSRFLLHYCHRNIVVNILRNSIWSGCIFLRIFPNVVSDIEYISVVFGAKCT